MQPYSPTKSYSYSCKCYCCKRARSLSNKTRTKTRKVDPFRRTIKRLARQRAKDEILEALLDYYAGVV